MAAAPETCQGRTATIVGIPLSMMVEGTDGDDVIVTNGARNVSALGGDDLVCITGTGVTAMSANGYYANGGRGSDTIVNLDDDRVATNTAVDMGDGDGTTETYIGGTGPDELTLSGRDTVARIRTGSGNDVVTFTYPPRRIEIDLGKDGDSLDLPFQASTRGRIAGGGGPDSLTPLGPRTRGAPVDLDNRRGEVRVGRRATLRLAGLERFSIYGFDATPLTVTGGPAAESVFVANPTTQVRAVNLGDGRDELHLALGARVPRTARGGTGSDRLSISADPGSRDAARLRGDLAAGRIRVQDRSGGRTRDMGVASFETVSVSAGDVRLLGTDRAEKLDVAACVGLVDGRRGDDLLDNTSQAGDPQGDTIPNPDGCSTGPTLKMRGGAGDDTLYGSAFSDVLIGGDGNDTAHGEGGGDTCDAETTSGCEDPLLPPITTRAQSWRAPAANT
ncbi:MAG: calcium-binding protein [Nocardioides sp.]|nr:calcium-binding protein [Nocardioides sp.]